MKERWYACWVVMGKRHNHPCSCPKPEVTFEDAFYGDEFTALPEEPSVKSDKGDLPLSYG